MKTRILSAMAGIVITFGIIMYGSWLFTGVVTVFAVLAFVEYARAFAKKTIYLPRVSGCIAVGILTLSGAHLFTGPIDLFIPIAALIMLIFLFRMIFCYTSFSPIQAAVIITGVLYIGGGFYYMMQMRFAFVGQVLPTSGVQVSLLLIWLTLLTTWASDSFAYFTGSFFGRHKLCPKISPNKTIEGFIGGLLGTVIVAVIIGYYMQLSLPLLAVLGAVIAIIATLGDLVESIIKRYTGIKDSGNLIPGHGGVLDRFDSLLFTAPLVYYFYLFIHPFLID